MGRKIIKLAEKTLVVSLPTAWVENQGLSKGDELDCLSENNKLIFIPQSSKPLKRSISIDVADSNERVLRWQISSLHKQGYDEIILTNYSDNHFDILQDLISNLFIGFIIKEQSKIRIVVSEVAAIDIKEFDTTLRRAFRLLLVSLKETREGLLTSNEELLHRQLVHEKENNKLTNFCERLLNKNLLQKDKGHFWYVVAWNLEKVADNLKYISENVTSISKDVDVLYGEVISLTEKLYELFYSFDFDKLVEFSAMKKELDVKCHELLRKGNDAVLLHYLHIIVMQLADFSASTIAVRFEN